MNNAVFAGRLGRDAETRNTQGGNQVTNFSLAVDEYAGGGERRTLWVDCNWWGERGAKVAEYLAKGTPVAVSGQAGIRTYESNGETRAVLTLNVRDVTLLGSRQDGEHGGQRQARPSQSTREAHGATGSTRGATRPGQTQQRQAPAQQSRTFDDVPMDDDIPF
ncbi:MAG TPA: single-stranded DNA-binding protein [Pseudoxanthomonas sp.]